MAKKPKIKEGFYWCALEGAEDWSVAHRFNNRWYTIGVEEDIPPDEITIGEFIGGEREYRPGKKKP